MKTKITKSWFRSGNEQLKELALWAFGEDALTCSFKEITTFEKACEVLGLLQCAVMLIFLLMAICMVMLWHGIW